MYRNTLHAPKIPIISWLFRIDLFFDRFHGNWLFTGLWQSTIQSMIATFNENFVIQLKQEINARADNCQSCLKVKQKREIFLHFVL